MKKQKTMMQRLIENWAKQKLPIEIKEFLIGLVETGYLKQWEQIDDDGLVFKVVFNE